MCVCVCVCVRGIFDKSGLRHVRLWVAWCYTLTILLTPGTMVLYGYNGLIIVDNCTPRKSDIIRKNLYWLLDKFGFKFDIQTNLKVTDYLNSTLNMYYDTVFPFRKITKTRVIST